jgi:hypothetical protein
MNRELYNLVWYTRAEFVLMRRHNNPAKVSLALDTEDVPHEEMMSNEVDEIICNIIYTLDNILASENVLFNTLLLIHVIQSLTVHSFNMKACHDGADTSSDTFLSLDNTHVRIQCHLNILLDVCKSNLVSLCSKSYEREKVPGTLQIHNSNMYNPGLRRNTPFRANIPSNPSFRSNVGQNSSVHTNIEQSQLLDEKKTTSIYTTKLDTTKLTKLDTPKLDKTGHTNWTHGYGNASQIHSYVRSDNPRTASGISLKNPRTEINSHKSKGTSVFIPMRVRSCDNVYTARHHTNPGNRIDLSNHYIRDMEHQHNRIKSKIFCKSLVKSHTTATMAISNCTMENCSGLPVHDTTFKSIRQPPQSICRWPTQHQILKIGSIGKKI